jgi:hypothetical protein
MFEQTLNGDFSEACLSLKCIISLRDGEGSLRESGERSLRSDVTHFVVTSLTDTEALKFEVQPFPSPLKTSILSSSHLQASEYGKRLEASKLMAHTFNQLEDQQCFTLVDLVVITKQKAEVEPEVR